MKKIISIFLASIFGVFAFAITPTKEQTETVKAVLAQIEKQIPKGNWNEYADYGRARAELGVIWAFAKEFPLEFNQWRAQNFKGLSAYRIAYMLKGYQEKVEPNFEITPEISSCFAFYKWWEIKAQFVERWAEFKEANFTIADSQMRSYNVFRLASAVGDVDFILNPSEEALIQIGLNVLPFVERACARLDTTTLEDAERVWKAYVRIRKILTPYKDNAINSKHWARLIANENYARYDYKCALADSTKTSK